MDLSVDSLNRGRWINSLNHKQIMLMMGLYSYAQTLAFPKIQSQPQLGHIRPP